MLLAVHTWTHFTQDDLVDGVVSGTVPLLGLTSITANEVLKHAVHDLVNDTKSGFLIGQTLGTFFDLSISSIRKRFFELGDVLFFVFVGNAHDIAHVIEHVLTIGRQSRAVNVVFNQFQFTGNDAKKRILDDQRGTQIGHALTAFGGTLVHRPPNIA